MHMKLYLILKFVQCLYLILFSIFVTLVSASVLFFLNNIGCVSFVTLVSASTILPVTILGVCLIQLLDYLPLPGTVKIKQDVRLVLSPLVLYTSFSSMLIPREGTNLRDWSIFIGGLGPVHFKFSV